MYFPEDPWDGYLRRLFVLAAIGGAVVFLAAAAAA
jgi:hypothetical protein